MIDGSASGGADFYVSNSGNVGIGTTSPTEKLQITGNVSASGDFIGTNFTGSSFTGSFVGDGSGLTGVLVNSGSWDGIFSGSAQITGSLGVTGSMLVNGNVGIGTTSPSTKLEVVGNILANATNATVNIGSTISSAPTYGYANTAAGSLVVGGYTNGGFSYQPGVITLINQNPGLGAGADLGVIQFAGKDDATSGYVSTIIKAFTATGVGSGNSGGGILTISTTPGYGAPTERFRINQNGNVGIGTTAPTEKLQITGNVSASGDFIGTNFTGSSFTGSFVGDGSGLIGIDSGSWDGIFSGSAQITGSLGVTGSVLVDGNVGIGTTDPQEKLDISAGDIRLDDNFSINWATNDANIGRVRIAGNEANDFLQFVTDNSERMRLTNTGVGIGTTSPTEKLQVTGNVSASGDFIGTNFTGSSFTGSFVGDGSGLTGIDSGSWDGIFSGSAQITGSLGVTGSVLVDGNVGIGTTSPAFALDTVTDSIILGRFSSTSFKAGLSIQEADDGGYLSTEAGRICLGDTIGVSANNLTYIMSTKRLGIGISSPLKSVDIVGDLGTTTTAEIGTSLTVGTHITASGNVSASGDFIGRNFTGSSFTGSFVGDGSGLTNLPISDPFPFTGSAQITGSLGVTGSVEVEGYIKASGSIQVGVNEGSPTAALVGSIRYKSDANNSFVDMVMQTDVTTYEWVNIVTNTW